MRGICVGSVGVHSGSVRVLKYQHVGIKNTKLSNRAYTQCKTPTRRGFALWWNIGFKPIFHKKTGLRWVPGLASGNENIHISDTNMLVSPTKNSGVGGSAQRQIPTPGILRSGGI